MKQHTVNGLSGLVTGVAAGGVIFVWKNSQFENRIHKWLIELRVEWRTIAGFTAPQELSLSAHHATALGAYTGGTDLAVDAALAHDSDDTPLSPTSGTGFDNAELADGDIRIADNAALGGGVGTVIVAQPFAWDGFGELATGAGVQKGLLQLQYRPINPKPYGYGTGFVVRMPIAMGAAGTGRFHVRATWKEQVTF